MTVKNLTKKEKLTQETTAITNILSTVTALVTEGIKWVGQFVTAIISNELLLLFVVAAFVGLGIGLIKRIIRL